MGNDSKRHRPKGSKHDHLPSKETMATLVGICSSKTRAAVLLLASSGIRVGELVRLRVNDLDFTGDLPTVRIRNGLQPQKWRISYITEEARQALDSYLSERKNHGEDIGSESPLFAYESGSSMTPQAMVSLIRRGFQAAGIRGPNMRLESQVLRRWFKKQLIGIGAPRKVVDFLCGQIHRWRPSEEEVKLWYVRAIPSLTIADSPQ